MSRSARFADIEYNSSPRCYNQPNPHSTKTPPSNFQQVQTLLQQELNANSLYRTTWRKASEEYKVKKRYLSSDHFASSVPEECYIAVIAYTFDEVFSNRKLYEDFNRKFRQLDDEASWNNFPYKSFYYLLLLAVPGIKNVPDPGRKLYRGIRGIHFPRAPKVGDDFYFDYFASSSSDFQVACGFMGAEGTMIVMRDGAEAAMGITNYSCYMGEDEVLILPCNKFRVVSFKRNGPIDLLEVERARSGGFLEALVMGLGLGVLGAAAFIEAALANKTS